MRIKKRKFRQVDDERTTKKTMGGHFFRFIKLLESTLEKLLILTSKTYEIYHYDKNCSDSFKNLYLSV